MRKITLDEILIKVCDHYCITEAQIKGIDRNHKFVKARQMYSYIAMTVTKKTTTQIGEEINRNHSTISHAKKKISNLMDVYPIFRKEVLHLMLFYDFKYTPIVVNEVNLIQLIKQNKLICSK